jgi:predicted metal-dependent peptidase
VNEIDQKLISASLLRLRMKSPFFATIALFAQFRPTQQLDTAATDGKDIFFNPDYLRSLSPAQQDGLLLHEVLHAALLHVLRRGVREQKVWNVAADIIVNGAIAQQGFELPPGGLRDLKLEHLCVEEIYELLLKKGSDRFSLPMADLIGNAPGDCSDSVFETNHTDAENTKKSFTTDSLSQARQAGADLIGNAPGDGSDSVFETNRTDAENAQKSFTTDSLSQARQAEIETHWRNALQQAAVVARTVSQGKLPAGMERELASLTSPQLDWRSYLWRYLVQTPTDFIGFDRRFIGRGLYLEALVGESVRVFVAVDTSGSIDNEQLRMFLSEVQGILSAYPHLQCDLYYVDAEAYGPHPLNPDSNLPSPKGGGGTSFVPFFSQVQETWDGHQGICIYLTDGYGTFPEQPPELPTLWVVTPGGLDLSQFPFGEAVRLLSF